MVADLYIKEAASVAMQLLSSSKKHACGDFFDDFAPFAYEPAARRAANGDRNPLLRKGSETTAHVAGFGLAIRGLRPSDTSRVFSQSAGRAPSEKALSLENSQFVYAGGSLSMGQRSAEWSSPQG